MSTSAAATLSAPGLDKSKRAERRFFSAYTLSIALVIFTGFAPSFFLRGIVPPYAPLDVIGPALIVHGVLAAGYVFLFPLQAALISAGRRQLHMALGNWGFALGALMIPAGYAIGALQYRKYLSSDPATAAILAGIALSAMPSLLILTVAAWRKRFDGQAHKRLMVAIACVLADPAIARLPLWSEPPFIGFVQASIAMLLMLAPLWAWDLATRRKLHWATALGTGVYFFELASRLVYVPTAGWTRVVELLPGYGWP
jgi:hypothetical protein